MAPRSNRQKTSVVSPTLYVHGLPSDISEGMVREYFSRYGRVMGVRLGNNFITQASPDARVTFLSSDMAKAAHADAPHSINGNFQVMTVLLDGAGMPFASGPFEMRLPEETRDPWALKSERSELVSRLRTQQQSSHGLW